MRRRIIITAALSLAILLFPSGTYVGVKAEPVHAGHKLVGTWEVTLRFPECSMACPCPGGVPNIPLPVVQTYSKDGTMSEVSGGTLYRSDALGTWEHVRDQEYSARYKFFIFNPTTGARMLTEVVASQIQLQGRDAFEATATVDLFAADGSLISSGCPINITGTRL